MARLAKEHTMFVAVSGQPLDTHTVVETVTFWKVFLCFGDVIFQVTLWAVDAAVEAVW